MDSEKSQLPAGMLRNLLINCQFILKVHLFGFLSSIDNRASLNIEGFMLTQDVWMDFHDRIYSFVKKRVNNPDDVRDLIQDIFLKIHRNLHTLTNMDKLSSWVYRIVRNTIVDFYKKKRANMGIELAGIHAVSSSESYMNEELADSVVPFIEQLGSDYRDAIRATDINGMSQKQFAEINGLTYSAAKSRIQRARVQLRNLFDQCCKIDADRYGNILDVAIEKKCSC